MILDVATEAGNFLKQITVPVYPILFTMGIFHPNTNEGMNVNSSSQYTYYTSVLRKVPYQCYLRLKSISFDCSSQEI